MTTTDTTTIAPHPGEEGTAVLEFAAVFLLLVTLVWGAVTYGLVLTVDHALNAASAEGARAAIGAATEAEAVMTAEATALHHLEAIGAEHVDAATVTATVVDCPAIAGTRCITVDVTYDWATEPLAPELFPALSPDELGSVSTIQLTS